MNKFVVPVAIIAIIVAVGVVTYTLGTNQTKQSGSTVSPVPTKTGQPTEVPTPTNVPTEPEKSSNKSQLIENIQAAVQSKNYAALEGYMANEVSVILYASECCGVLSPQKATEQMAYLNNGTPPWDFSTNNPIAQKLIATDPSNFAGRMIGIASNGMAVAFNLNAQNKIDKIFISADYKLISP